MDMISAMLFFVLYLALQLLSETSPETDCDDGGVGVFVLRVPLAWSVLSGGGTLNMHWKR